MLRIDFERSMGDALAVAKRMIRSNKADAQRRLRIRISFPISIVVFATLLSAALPLNHWFDPIKIGVAAVVGFGLSLAVTSQQSQLEAWHKILVNNLGPWPRPETWTVDESGVEESLPHVQSFRPWSRLRQVEREKLGLTLLWMDGSTSLLPEHVVTSELIEFIELHIAQSND